MLQVIAWIVTGAALIGVVLNIKKDLRCFLIWIFTNAFWCMYDFYLEAWAQSALFLVYFFLALWGLWKWKQGEKHAGS